MVSKGKHAGRVINARHKLSPRQVSVDFTDLRFPEVMLKQLGIDPKDYDAVTAFGVLNDQEKVRAARQIIDECVIGGAAMPDARFALAVEESESLLKGYATLDEPHRHDIKSLMEQITAYLRDSTRKRPLNALMLAAPGAGKSHFIRQLAERMREDRVQAVTFNMATMQSTGDMAQPVDELRNVKVNDRFPLLFLDEFDSDPARYALLLPLLWDGELQIGHRVLKVGKAVIVLAGSHPDLPKAMDQSATMRMDVGAGGEFKPVGKLVDLLSRINGGSIEIPDLDLRSEHRDRRVDKVCLTISLIRARFGDAVNAIPRSLLRFVAHTQFRYGVRSIAHLVDCIDSRALDKSELRVGYLGLPIASEESLNASSLRLHFLDKDQGFGIVNRWVELSRDQLVVNVEPQHILPFARGKR